MLDDRTGRSGIGHRMAVRLGDAACGTDLGDGGLGVADVCALPRHVAAQVVDQHPRAPIRQQAGIGLAQSAARPGDDGHLAVET